MKSIADYFHLPEKMCANSFEVAESMETSSSKNNHIFVQKVKLNIQLKESSESGAITSQAAEKAAAEESQKADITSNICKLTDTQEKDDDATAKKLLKTKEDKVANEMTINNVKRRKRMATTEKPVSKQVKRRKHSAVIVESGSVDEDDDDADDDDNIIDDDDDSDSDLNDTKRKAKRRSKKAIKETHTSSQKQKKKRKAESGGSARAEGSSSAKRLRVSPKSVRQHKDSKSDKVTPSSTLPEKKSKICENLQEEKAELTESTSKKNNMFGKLDIIITKSDRSVTNVKLPTADKESEINCDRVLTSNKINCTVSNDLTDSEQKEKKQNNFHNSVSPDEDARKQSNLLNYFGKVSKQDIKSKPDRIEVQAIVHTPVSSSSSRGKSSSSKLRLKKTRKGKAASRAAEAADTIEVLESEDLSINDDQVDNTKNTEAIQVADNCQLSCPVSSVVNEEIKDKISSPGKVWKLRIRLRDANADENESSSTGTSNTKHSFFKQCQEKKEETFLQEKTIHTKSRRNRLSLSNNQSVLNETEMSSSEAETSAVSQITSEIDSETMACSKVCSSPEKVKSKECLRLAPVFTKKVTKKPKPDADSILAKKSFLESGVPETLKKTVEMSRLAEEQEQALPIFPAISHIQQLENEDTCNLPSVVLPLKGGVQELDEENCSGRIWLLKELVHIQKDSVVINCQEKLTFPPPVLYKIVSDIKSKNSDLPVRRLFKNLANKYILGKGGEDTVESSSTRKKKKRLRNRKSKQHATEQLQKTPDPEPTVSWCEKYKPVNSNEVISTRRMAMQLKKWLESWKLRSKDTKNQHKKIRNGASSSDEEFEYSESSGSSDFNKAAVLLGPHGSGKTSSVYAVANELGFEVLEINASSRRTGKRILADLQEATQSHRIGVPGADSNQTTITKIFKKGKNNSKTDSNERPSKKEMSLILVEEVDIVFDDYDDGFVSALSTLVTTSKRPVIFTATDENCLQVTRLVDKYLVLKYDVVPSRLLNIWLQLVCLLEGVRVASAAITKVLEFTHYDIRKSMMLLQFWVLSGGENFPFDCVSNSDSLLPFVSSESGDNSNLSCSSLNEEVSVPDESVDCTGLFTDCNNCMSHNLHVPFPLNLCGLWWNLAPLLGIPQVKLRGRREVLLSRNKQPKKKECDTFLYYDSDSADDEEGKKNWDDVVESVEDDKCDSAESEHLQNSIIKTPNKCSSKVIKAMADLMDSLSSVDVMNFTVEKCRGNSGYREMKVHCWDQKPQDSTSLLEDQTEVSSLELPSLAHCLTERSIVACRKDLNILEHQKYNQVLPSHETIRLISEEHFLSSAVWDIVPQSCWLSRNAMSTDYCPLIRSMSRLQDSHLRIQQMATTRCRQRYFHYLKDLGTSADIATCKALCSVLNNE